MQGRAQARGVRLESRLGQLPRCQVDPEGLHRALLNIVSNAFDAVEEKQGAHVAVGTVLEAGGAWVRVLVLDNGTGIPTEVLADLFKPFLSTKGARGTGLGLAVSRKILREHGGDILVKSAEGKGSHFILRFPVKSTLGPDVTNTVTSGMMRLPDDELA
jgi:signal transduction histidine kinase